MSPNQLPLQPIEPVPNFDIPGIQLAPEEIAALPTAAEEIGVVDGEFQVWRNPAEGETEGHFETGWTVRDALNKRLEDGSLVPVVVVEKQLTSPDGSETTILRKTIDQTGFLSWQPSATSEASRELVPEVNVAEELGETALDRAGAVLVELAAPVVEAAAETASASPENSPVDLEAIFADGASLEAAILDPTITPEIRTQLTMVAEQWKASHAVVAAMEQIWGEDLQPSLQRVIQELPQAVSTTHQLLAESVSIVNALQQLGNAREYRDSESAARVLRQLNLDVVIPTLSQAANQFDKPTELVPSGRTMSAQAEDAFMRVNHARYSTEVSPKDYEDAAAYARPLLTAGASLSAVCNEMEADSAGALQSWNTTQNLVEETAMLVTRLSSSNDVSPLLHNLASHLSRLQQEPTTEYVWDMKSSAVQLQDGLEHLQRRLHMLQVAAEEAASRRH